MNILVVAATFQEIAPTIRCYSPTEKLSENLVKYSTSNKPTLYFLVTGVSMLATSFQVTSTLTKLKIDLVINAGIAGAIDECKIGEVLNVVSDCVYELGAENANEFIAIQDMNLLSEADFPLTENHIRLLPPSSIKSISHLVKANGITVNKVHGSSESILKVKKYVERVESSLPFIESMEGAAVAYVCAKLNIMSIQLRSISNMVEVRNRENWNIPLAIDNLNNILSTVLTELIDK